MPPRELCYEDVQELEPSRSIYKAPRLFWQAVSDAMPQWVARDAVDDFVDSQLPRLGKSFVLVNPETALGVDSLEDLFRSHAETWKKETLTSSSLANVAMHPSYQRIIGLGPRVVPFILRDLHHFGGPWFWALRALTGENPVPPEHRGKISLMTEDWLQWGRERGHL